MIMYMFVNPIPDLAHEDDAEDDDTVPEEVDVIVDHLEAECKEVGAKADQARVIVQDFVAD